VTFALDQLDFDHNEEVISYLQIPEKSPLCLGNLVFHRDNLTLKEGDRKTIFPFLRKTGGVESPPEALTTTIKRVIFGFLPILRIFKGFGQWTHKVHDIIKDEKYTVTVKSTSWVGSYVRHTKVEYRKHNDYTDIVLTIRGKNTETLEGYTISALTEKIGTYLDTRQWGFASRYEAQSQRIAAMLRKTHV
jgi:hypothetical protein